MGCWLLVIGYGRGPTSSRGGERLVPHFRWNFKSRDEPSPPHLLTWKSKISQKERGIYPNSIRQFKLGVPEGSPTIARRFNAVVQRPASISPGEGRLTGPSEKIQPSRSGLMAIVPGNPALKRRANVTASLRDKGTDAKSITDDNRQRPSGNGRCCGLKSALQFGY